MNLGQNIGEIKMKSKKVTWFIVVFLLLCMPAMAQQVKLTILKKRTGQPAIAANVEIEDNEKMQHSDFSFADINALPYVIFPRNKIFYYKVISVELISLMGILTSFAKGKKLYMTEDVMRLNELNLNNRLP